jgi:hypothetical protein
MEGLIHMEVAQLPHHAGQVPVIHPSRRSIGTLSADQLGFFEAHDKLTRDIPHEQVMDRFLVRLGHWQLRHRISFKRILSSNNFA